MHGLPEELPTGRTQAYTGLVCPECSGNLVVNTEQGHVSFICRVGHTYSVTELVVAKEAVLEASMWRAVFAFEELQALVSDLGRHGLTESFGADGYRARCDLAQQQAERLRVVIETDRPLAERPEARS